MIELFEDTQGNPVREKINALIKDVEGLKDLLDGVGKVEEIQMPMLGETGKKKRGWHEHPYSDDLILDGGNFTWEKSKLSNEQKREIVEEMGILEKTYEEENDEDTKDE